MQNNPRVSIILTTYNRPQLLKKALESVRDQDYENWECLVMDDNSSDKQQKKILSSEDLLNDSRFIVKVSTVKPEERSKTARYATLINEALDMARGEFITYLCDDDFYFPYRLSEMLAYFDQHPEVSVVYGRQQVIDVINGAEQVTIRKPDIILDNANCQVDHSSVMHRKSVIDVVGKWDDDSKWWGGADGQFWEKLGKAGFHFHPINVITDAHLVHSGSWTREANWEKLGTKEEPK